MKAIFTILTLFSISIYFLTNAQATSDYSNYFAENPYYVDEMEGQNLKFERTDNSDSSSDNLFQDIFSDDDLFNAYFDDFEVSPTEKKTSHKELNFMVLGDFGYVKKSGPYNGLPELSDFIHTKVNQAKSTTPYDFIVSVGDFLYHSGVQSENDPKVKMLFEDALKIEELGLDWYSTMGNHDGKGNLTATYNLYKQYPRWKYNESYYSRTFNIGSSHLKTGFIFLNGNELVCLDPTDIECFADTAKNLNFEELEEQLIWFENVLIEMSKDKDIVWKVVIIHQALFSRGKVHGDIRVLKEKLIPLFVKYNVDVVLSGHDHNVQYLRMDMNGPMEDDKSVPRLFRGECTYGEFFADENAEYGIINPEIETRMAESEQYEYLHQFVIGNGGNDPQRYCSWRNLDSPGKLRYANTVMGVGDIKITENMIDVKLMSAEDEVLFSVVIFRD